MLYISYDQREHVVKEFNVFTSSCSIIHLIFFRNVTFLLILILLAKTCFKILWSDPLSNFQRDFSLKKLGIQTLLSLCCLYAASCWPWRPLINGILPSLPTFSHAKVIQIHDSIEQQAKDRVTSWENKIFLYISERSTNIKDTQMVLYITNKYDILLKKITLTSFSSCQNCSF